MKDRLYLLKPDFDDAGIKHFCAECAMVEGMLSFYPHIRKNLEIKYVNFKRPRPDIVAELGAEHQSSPVIILADPTRASKAQNAKPKVANGKTFFNDPYEVCEYLAAAHAVGRPHK
jgi:hypothetical protein